MQWAQRFEEIVWLDSNEHHQNYSSFDAILAVEAFTAIKTDYKGAFDQLKEYQELTADWIFGYLSYDLKNDVEELTSGNHDGLQFPDLYFFQPKKIFLLKGNEVEIQYLRMVDDEIDPDLEEISNQKESGVNTAVGADELNDRIAKAVKKEVSGEGFQNYSSAIPQPVIKARMSRNKYLEKVKTLQQHIQRGDIYEANFCQEFYAEDAKVQPLATFRSLNEISNPPFATFLKLDDRYLFSASPERYLKKEGTKVISQPIKGTARRSEDPEEDEQLIRELQSDPKERSENVMIVDLVRNDLSKTAKKGSVEVEEMCRVYTFKQVHQLISTIKAQIAEGIPTVELLRSTFPMGSMTGAPKISAMEILERLEETKRGLYSGAVGYFSPNQDFDFNVVIRSILYNRNANYISFSVGGAITVRSIPEREYEECLLKAKAMKEVLQKNLVTA